MIASTRAVARLFGDMPRERTATLGSLGLLLVSAERIDAMAPPAGERFGLVVNGQRGQLTVQNDLAAELVSAVLGAPPPRVPRRLGPSERGILAGLVLSWLGPLRSQVGLTLGPEASTARQTSWICVELAVHGEEVAGLAWLDLPSSALAGASATCRLDAAAMSLLPDPELVVELSRTTLDRGAWAEAQTGDALVCEGGETVDFEARCGGWPVRLRVGCHVAAGTISSDGIIQAATAFMQPFVQPLMQQGKVTQLMSESDQANTIIDMDIPPADPSAQRQAAEVMAAAPVEIVVELGRVVLRGDELLGLIKGGVLSLGADRSHHVDLRVGSRLWARGELVTVEGELGVRLTVVYR